MIPIIRAKIRLLPLMFLAAVCYDLALWWDSAASVWLTAASAAAFCMMARANTARQAFYAGIGAALLIYVPHLWFLTSIFQLLAGPLWLSLALWPGVFCGTLHVVHRKLGAGPSLAVAPVLWLGLEYFRSEVWMLHFSWLTPGFALPADKMGWLYQSLGVYGSGAVLVLAGAAWGFLKKPVMALAAGLLIPALLLPGEHVVGDTGSVRITGVQFEGAMPDELLAGLEEARTTQPDTGLYILPEYSFPGPVPAKFLAWCKTNHTWLIAGGKDFLKGRKNHQGELAYYNKAFVIGPAGTVVHRQAKSRPIQFFDDGERAASQEVWSSPWGRFGICICYDQNYSKVTDPLAAQQMQALLIPTLDLESWGSHQHWLSARLAAVRAAEYGVPVIRLASSGFSQFLDARGGLLASGSMPGQREIVSAMVQIGSPARQPWDRLPAQVSIYAAGGCVLWAMVMCFLEQRQLQNKSSAEPSLILS